MKLRSLVLYGFKSFADRTELELRDGLTAIVGSNGCGKSNIADAVRWVLGEQRASALRGSKMDEVIFQGAGGRRPLQMAEVSLTFLNDAGRIAIPQQEIRIDRKVFREGGSEYALNGNGCRLRDIHDLLRDTGLGSDAYSIIEASMIETILSDRTDERRGLFEEAAGIGGYKDRRRSALRQLESALADLERLDDLVAEVESKVRALSRQRGRAQRFREMRERKLALDVALATAELEALDEALVEDAREMEALAAEIAAAGRERTTLETAREERRSEATLLSRQRAGRAAELDAASRAVEAHERDILVADERHRNLEERIEALARERSHLEERIEAGGEDVAGREAEVRTADERIVQLAERLEAAAGRAESARAELSERRGRHERALEEARSVSGQLAEARAGRVAVESEIADGRARLEARTARLEAVSTRLAVASEQTDLFGEESRSSEEALAECRRAVQETREKEEELTTREQKAAAELRGADDRVSRLSASVRARQAIASSREDLAPAVTALLEAGERFPGVRGPLADFIDPDGMVDPARIDRYLGRLVQALVVDDMDTARAVRNWFREEYGGPGSLILLPLDAPALTGDGSRVTGSGTGPGAPWVDHFLGGVSWTEGEEETLRHVPEGARVGGTGESVDSYGIARLSSAGGDDGLLARREELRRESDALEQESAVAEDLRGVRDRLREEIEAARRARREAVERLRKREDSVRQARSEAALHEERTRALRAEKEELATAVERSQAELARAGERYTQLDARLAQLQRASEHADHAVAAAAEGLAELEDRWEEARSAAEELRIGTARAEGERREVASRLETLQSGIDAASTRLGEIGDAASSARVALEGIAERRRAAEASLQEGFEGRDEAARRVARIEERLGAIEAEVATLDERLRDLRARESRASTRRHERELARSTRESTRARVRERVEVEWGQPWEVLAERAGEVEDGQPSEWRTEVERLAARLASLGPINMLAIEEHDEEQRRLSFLREQREDLVAARNDLADAVREINRAACSIFEETFEAARENFKRTFESLFHGGECDVWLADPDDPLESPIEIHACPGGKKTRRLSQLSGGERTLTALALLFGIYLVKPSPFCVLDEVDAPLDESNVGRFIRMLERFKEETQFIVITHNARTMESADWLYGVTMEEAGVSRVVGVELEEARELGEQQVA